MKKYILLFISLSFLCVKSFSQTVKANLLTDTTVRYFMDNNMLQLFSSKPKKEITSIVLSANVTLTAAINMNEWNDANTHTIGAKLLGYNETYLTISFYTNKGESFVRGEIFSTIENIAFKIYNSTAGKICFERTTKDQIIAE